MKNNNNELFGKQILVFAPKFFGYEKALVEKLEELGAEVSYYDSRPSNSTLGKAIIRLQKGKAEKWINNFYEKLRDELLEQNFTEILFFQPEATPRWFLLWLKEKFPAAKRIMYLWDSVSDRPDSLDDSDCYDEIFTFDPDDYKSFNLKFRPLFYSDDYLKKSKDDHEEFRYDFSFIGTVRNDRFMLLEQLKRNALSSGQNFFLFYYLQSKIVYLYFKMVKGNFSGSHIKDFSFKPLEHSKIQDIIRKTKVVIDIQKPHQVGLTIRTIELLAAKRKFVTTNSEVIKYDFYNSNDIGLLSRDEPQIPNDFISAPFIEVDEGILERYSIGYFLKEILGMEQPGEYYVDKRKIDESITD